MRDEDLRDNLKWGSVAVGTGPNSERISIQRYVYDATASRFAGTQLADELNDPVAMDDNPEWIELKRSTRDAAVAALDAVLNSN